MAEKSGRFFFTTTSEARSRRDARTVFGRVALCHRSRHAPAGLEALRRRADGLVPVRRPKVSGEVAKVGPEVEDLTTASAASRLWP